MKELKIILAFLCIGVQSFAQTSITGRVVDLNGTSIPGASVVVKNFTSSGTTTDIDGNYTIKIPDEAETLVFSFIGMQTKEVPIKGQTIINVTLHTGNIALNEVVVTSLGIKRKKKSLGYAVQDVKGDEISKTNPDNIVSSLSGKVAGAQIVTSSGQVGASSTIKIRGNKSFTGSAEPLFVVDGTPIMNGISSAQESATYTDFGNAAMDIDPANIESISVLKGASAAALYGSRAANGVILITTKKGAAQKGMGVEFSSSVSFDKVYILPNYQNEYGQGRNGSEYEWKNNYSDLTYQEFHDLREFRWALDGSGYRMDWDESWGSRLDAGLLVDQMHGKKQPWVSRPDNVKDFFETGSTYTNNIALSGGNDKATGRLTLGHTSQKGTSPNTDQTKINIGLNTMFKLNDKFKVNANVTFSNLSNDNLPQQGNSMRNPLVEFNSWFGRQVDTKYLKDHYNDIVFYDGELKAFNWMMDYSSQHSNPYWIANKNTMSRERNRVYGNISLNYEIMNGVDLMARVGTDFFNESRKYVYHQYTRDWTDAYKNANNGTFWHQYRLESETNADLMLNIDKNITEDVSLFATVGANYRRAFDQFATTSGTNLVVPNFFSTSNYEGEPNVDFTRFEKETNSIFASANFGYKNYLFLDLTLRGDWSSTLPKENWNFWYPSTNLGFIFSEAFGLQSNIFTYGKVRGGYAVVGNGTSPYELRAIFSPVGTTFNGINMFRVSSVLPTANLKPEKTKSIEFGTELKFLGNRLGVDVTYYKAKTINQLLAVSIPYSSGHESWMKNAGEIENKGVELQLYGNPVKTGDFSWNVDINWSKNKNKVVKLEDGLEELEINYIMYGTSVMAFPGEEWGVLYGTSFERNDAGKIIVGANGLPNTEVDPRILGKVNPDWIGGIRNTFSYKRLSLSALIDFRKGGDVFSRTKAVGQKSGILQATVEGGIRENGMIVDGVYEEGATIDDVDVSGQPNTTRISARTYWRSSRNWAELSIIDGSFIKLREVSLTYQLPKSLLSKVNIQNASISMYGRNLALLHTHKSNDVNIDPEVSFGGTVEGTGEEAYQMPSSRTIGFKLNLKF